MSQDDDRERSKHERIERLRKRTVDGETADQLRSIVLGILDLLEDEL